MVTIVSRIFQMPEINLFLQNIFRLITKSTIIMNIKNIITAVVLAVFTFVFQATSAQTTIKTITALKQKSSYPFSQEWQYLSSDLYLLNAQKFSNLLNDISAINSSGKRKKRKLSKEILQSLFIKAKIKNIRFFGGDVVYPIYSFKVTENKDYTTVETGNIEVVRLIDNLPLNESNEVIDAEISGEAITQKNTNEFLKVIAKQLQGLSQISKPNTAILDLLGELGKYIESKTTGKQYKFSSTIRLYEGQEFDKRLHSVNVFVFAPSTVTTVNIIANSLKLYIDSAENPQINQETIARMVKYKKYPMIVVANYKSRYNSQLVIGDQINFDYLSKRKLKIQNAYQNELINKTTYNQELKLIEFLEIFADLKLNISNYKLNLKNNITNDYSKNLFLILKIYRDLLKTKQLRLIQFYDNSEFENEFLPKYESVITTAGLYLNEKNSLTNIKEVAELIERSKNQNQNWTTEAEENNLRLLYSVKIPESEIRSEQAKELNRLIYKSEQTLFNKVYSTVIAKVNKLETNEAGLQEKGKVENQSGNTYCKKCKDELSKALNNYNLRYQANEKNKLIQKNDSIKQSAISVLFTVLTKKNCIDLSLQKDSTSAFNDLILLELDKLEEIIDETRKSLKQDTKQIDIHQLKEQNSMLEAYIRRLKTGFANLCKNVSNKCECSEK